MTNEADIQKAIHDLDLQEAPNYSATARKFNIDRKTLQRRHQGMSRSIQQAHAESLQLLTDGQEEVLIQHIDNLSDRGLPPTPQILRNLVFEIVKKQPGKNWVATFCKRHQNKIKSLYLRAIAQTRQVADNSAYFKYFYANLKQKVEKYHIKPHNIHNFDEKGFLLGLCHSTKRIVGIAQLKSMNSLVEARTSITGSMRVFAVVLISVGASQHKAQVWAAIAAENFSVLKHDQETASHDRHEAYVENQGVGGVGENDNPSTADGI